MITCIDAFTVCTGNGYAQLLKRNLSRWLDTVDFLVVVTGPQDDLVRSFQGSNLKVITTDLLTAYGAYLNKGAALCEGFSQLDSMDWLLTFDADTVPPNDWREVAEHEAEIGKIHGCQRKLNDRRNKDSLFTPSIFRPVGYFQLWHVKDQSAWKWPIYSPEYPHCATSDIEFMELWDRKNWKRLSFNVSHYGERKTNWFGEGNSKKQTVAQMLNSYPTLRKQNAGVLDKYGYAAPEPKIKLRLTSRDFSFIQECLQEAMQYGPFEVWINATRKEIPGKWVLYSGEDIQVVKSMIEGAFT